jgi:hypothetical protein
VKGKGKAKGTGAAGGVKGQGGGWYGRAASADDGKGGNNPNAPAFVPQGKKAGAKDAAPVETPLCLWCVSPPARCAPSTIHSALCRSTPPPTSVTRAPHSQVPHGMQRDAAGDRAGPPFDTTPPTHTSLPLLFSSFFVYFQNGVARRGLVLHSAITRTAPEISRVQGRGTGAPRS